jgi:hypothetical protein
MLNSSRLIERRMEVIRVASVPVPLAAIQIRHGLVVHRTRVSAKPHEPWRDLNNVVIQPYVSFPKEADDHYIKSG